MTWYSLKLWRLAFSHERHSSYILDGDGEWRRVTWDLWVLVDRGNKIEGGST